MLFEIVDSKLVVSEFALMIEPFCTIWETDTTERKENAMKLFMYIELVCSPKKSNPFFGYPEEIRPLKVKKEVYKDENYRTTDFMIQATERYREELEHASPTYSLLNAGLTASDKLQDFLVNFDLAERTPNGAMVIKPADITRALKELPDIAKGINSMIEKIKYELLEDGKTRGSRTIGRYEVPR